MAALYDNSDYYYGSALSSATVSGLPLGNGGAVNRVLYVFVYSTLSAGAPAPSGITWNTSENLTLIGTIIGTYGRYTVWRLIAPTATTADVVVSWGSTQDTVQVGVVSVKDADQTTPNGTVAAAGVTISSSASVVPATVSGDLVIAGLATLDINAGSVAATDTATQTNHINNPFTPYTNHQVGTKTAAGSSTTMSYSLSPTPGDAPANSEGWSMIGFNINSVGGGGGGGSNTVQCPLM